MPGLALILTAPCLLAGLALAQPAASAYAGSEACTSCHSEIAVGFRKTAMGRSMAAGEKGVVAGAAHVSSEKLQRDFDVFAKDGALYQSESKTENGKLVFRGTYALEYSVGSGNHGVTFMVRRGHHLFQAPLSWYSGPGAWALSPGYEYVDYGFNRPIQAGCIVCHSGRPEPVPERSGLFGDPPFRELAIGCENCHGPGASHAKDPTHGAIVNPARLPARLAENICMYCHQGGDARVLQPGKSYGDFRPGTWLGNTLAIFKIRTTGADQDLLEHHAAMAQSRCFIASQGKLACLTCHDPHTRVEAAQAAGYYRARCLTCHTDRSCSLPVEGRQPANDCAGCHMPKRDTTQISHTALTNHRIVKRPGTHAGTGRAEAELDWIDAPPGTGRVAPLTLLRAYGEVMDKQPEFRDRYLALVNAIAPTMPDDAFVQAALGRKLLYASTDGISNAAALQQLEKAVRLGARTAAVHQDVAEALRRLDRLNESAGHLRTAIEIEPFDPVIHKTLALCLIALKQYPEARETMRRYVELFPEDDFMRGLLAKAGAAQQ